MELRHTLLWLAVAALGCSGNAKETNVEAVRKAQGKFGQQPLSGEQVRWGFENLDIDESCSLSVLENGRVASEGSADALRARDDIQQFYLGVGSEGRTRFRKRSSG